MAFHLFMSNQGAAVFVVSKLLSAITQPLFRLAMWWLLALLLLGEKAAGSKADVVVRLGAAGGIGLSGAA